MKTGVSFFPTKAHFNSDQLHREHPYQLIRKHNQDDEFQEGMQNVKCWVSAQNIFKNPQREQKVDRPVGGIQLFKKIQSSKLERQCTNRRLSKRSHKEVTQSYINNNSTTNRVRKEKGQNQQRQNQQNSPIKTIQQQVPASTIQFQEENYKSHLTYFPETSILKPRTATQNSKSFVRSQKIRPSTSKAYNSKGLQHHQSWSKEQRSDYHDKNALLNQISYNKPLVQIYGDRYFEYILRNRFQQDLKPPAYIYQLSDKKFSSGKAISKIKYYRPDLKQKHALLIKGRKLKQEDSEN